MFEPRRLRVDDRKPLPARPLALVGRAEIRAQIEQIVLDPRQHGVELRLPRGMQTDEPDRGVDLVDGDGSRWQPLIEYLGIDFDPQTLERFTDVQLKGRMGDPTGRRLYSTLSNDPVGKWRGTLANRRNG